MTRNLKALGLALLALCALGAVAASGASAKAFTSTVTPTVLTGEQIGTEVNNVWGTKSSSLAVHCSKVTLGGTVVGKSAESITVHPTYTGCSAGVFGTAPIDTQGCNYVLHATTVEYKNTTGVKEGEAGKVDTECETGNAIKITGSGCTISLGAQVGLLGYKYVNESSGATADMKVIGKLDNIAYTSSGALCSLVGIKASGTDMFFTNEFTIKGFEDRDSTGPVANQDEFKEGSQVGIKYE